MKRILIAAIAAVGGVLVLGGTALAEEGADCALSYEVYEASVPHTDLEECPAGMAGEARFCRLSVVAEVATIFVFDENSGCLAEAKSFEEDEFSITIH